MTEQQRIIAIHDSLLRLRSYADTGTVLRSDAQQVVSDTVIILCHELLGLLAPRREPAAIPAAFKELA